ncbi:MAG: ABC transporter permease [Thermoplasmata archaeon]|nr:ABC transporter permease [Thermoplasmata archaeon]
MEAPNITRLIYRNIKVNTDPGTLTILIGLPAMYLVFFGFGFASLESRSGGGASYLSFLTPGLMAFQAVMAGTVGGGMLWADRRWGMLAQLLVGPFTRLQYLLGIMLTSVTFGLAGSLVMLGIAYVLLGALPVTLIGLGAMLAIITVGSLFFGSLMLLIAAKVKSNTTYNSIQILVLFLVNFASTVFYPYSSGLPAAIRVLFAVNPLTYIADVARAAYFGTYTVTVGYEALVLCVEAVIVLFLAVRAYLRSDVSMD